MNQKSQLKQTEVWLRYATHLVGLLPLAYFTWVALTGRLGFNPVETALRQSGRAAVACLLLSLAATPLRKIFNLPSLGRLRKPLGLYASLYAGLHFGVFAIWDYRLNLNLIWQEITGKPFIILGALGLIILAVLAATSFRHFQRTWGKKWVWLHRSVYAAAVLIIVHYLLAIKGDLLSLQGNYTWPLIAAGVLLVLFILRIPAVYSFFRRLTDRAKKVNPD